MVAWYISFCHGGMRHVMETGGRKEGSGKRSPAVGNVGFDSQLS